MSSSSLSVSILVPAFNGMPFLQYAVQSALSQRSGDFELVVSVDRSEDGSIEFLSRIDDSRLRVLETPVGSSYSMTEHWEWLLRQARGEWVMFLGQDDGLQSHFFELAFRLINKAQKLNLRLIAAQRAEFVWPYVGEKKPVASFRDPSREIISCHSLNLRALYALLSLRSYHFLPQMYTNSLWKMSLIEEVRGLQGGAFFTCHPQDANIAALGVRLEKKFLFSGFSLGWVGVSERSAGLAVAESLNPASPTRARIAQDYTASVEKSPIVYPTWAGEFEMGENAIYFWQALRSTRNVGSTPLEKLFDSVFFITVMLAFSLARHRVSSWTTDKLKQYRSFARRNRVPYGLVIFLSGLVRLGFFAFITLRSGFRNIVGFFGDVGKTGQWRRVAVSSMSEVIPLVQDAGSKTHYELDCFLVKSEESGWG